MRVILIGSLIYILFCTEFRFKPNQYIAYSSQVDYFIVIEDGIEDTIVSNNRADKTLYTFKSHSPRRTYIKLENEECEDSLSLKLVEKKNGFFTTNMVVEKGKLISVADCFKKYPESGGSIPSTQTWKNWWGRILKSCSMNFISCGPSPALLSGEKLDALAPKLDFVETNHTHYFDLENLSIHFRIHNDFPIKSLYVISHKGELIFSAGDTSLVGEVFDLADKDISKIEAMIGVKAGEKDYETHYQLIADSLKQYQINTIKPNQKYQLGIELHKDSSLHNPYLFNFQLITKKEKELYRTFFDD